MTSLDHLSAPVLSCADARDWESRLFVGDEAREWAAMQQAGHGVARAVTKDFLELGGLGDRPSVLVLAGKGHNGGDALIATQVLLRDYPGATADVIFVFGERSLRPLAARAWRELQQSAGARVSLRDISTLRPEYDIGLDGVFGFQFRPPLEPRVDRLIDQVNRWPIRLRAAVDLPSAGRFRADFIYATGSVKLPAVGAPGRLRYLDLGFFGEAAPSDQRILTQAVLTPLRALRRSESDKRSFGHVFVLGGSRSFPGAVLMTVLAALRSGAGLVTAFVPESLAPSFAARAPEAMWVGWPETPDGGLALEGEHLLRSRFKRANALVLGPGAGREPETLALLQAIVAASDVPMVIDADALQPAIIEAGRAARVVTPHEGEFKRIAGESGLPDYAARLKISVVLKGPMTRLSDGRTVYLAPFGGPVLARGGSGDLLAGMIGTQLAQDHSEPLRAAARGVVWHGAAADALARAHGQVAVRTTQLLDFLGEALQSP